MSIANYCGQTFDGYAISEIVATGPDEALLSGERVRDGERVWIRTARDRDDTSAHARFEVRYRAEQAAARRLASLGAVLPVREIIRLDGVPALVTDVPRGRSLVDVFTESNTAPPLGEVLPWLRRLMQAMEAAHDEEVAHGSLQGRAVYLGPDDRVTICGLASMGDAPANAEARRADVRSLAAIAYTATCGRAPRRGFPDTGMPVSPREYVDDYPASLARFLCRRLADHDDDPVEDAGVFRRSIDALSVDPEFRKAAGISDREVQDGTDVLVERSAGPRRRRTFVGLALGGAAVALAVLMTIAIMEGRVEEARRTASANAVQTPAEPVLQRLEHPRLAVWECLHHRFVGGDAGPVPPASLSECLRLAPDISPHELRAEGELLVNQLAARLESRDGGRSLGQGFERMFRQGADAVAQHVTYRLERDLSTEAIETWVVGNPSPGTTRVLSTLAATETVAAGWARGLMTRAGLRVTRSEP